MLKLLEVEFFGDVCGIFQNVHSNNIISNFLRSINLNAFHFWLRSSKWLSFYTLFLSCNENDILLHISKSPRSTNTRCSRNLLDHLLIKWANTNIIYCMSVRLRRIEYLTYSESLRLKLLPKLWLVNLHQCLQPDLLALFFYDFNLTFNFTAHDITVCFAGLYCRLFFYLVEVKKRVGGTRWGRWVNRQEGFSQKKKKKDVVSAVVKANNRGICSSLRDLHTAHYDVFFICFVFCFFYCCWRLNMPGGKSRK